MIYPGAPSIYYGDEIGMTGGHDPANRGAFPWHKPESWDRDLLHEFQRLIALRRQRPALRRGSFQFLWAADGVIAVSPATDAETIVAIFNASRETRRLDMPLGNLVADETVLTECWVMAASKQSRGSCVGLSSRLVAARVLATAPSI